MVKIINPHWAHNMTGLSLSSSESEDLYDEDHGINGSEVSDSSDDDFLSSDSDEQKIVQQKGTPPKGEKRLFLEVPNQKLGGCVLKKLIKEN